MLGVLRALDNHMPGQTVLDLTLRFRAAQAPGEKALRELLKGKGVHVGRISQCLQDRGEILQYTAPVEARGGLMIEDLIARVRQEPALLEYTAYHRSG